MYQLLFDKFFTIKGRGGRKEYIIKFCLIIIIFCFVSYTDKYIGTTGIYSFIITLTYFFIVLVLFIQYFPLAIRRLHDLNASGWYVLLTFAPFGQFLILWLMFKKGTTGPNKYGDPPEY